MKKLFFLLSMVLTLHCLPAFAQVDTEASIFNPITFTDGLGREVVIEAPVERVVTLLPSLTEIVCALGDETKLVAIDLNSDYPESISELPVISNPDMSLNYEQITALEPDIIFASDLISLDQVADLEKLDQRVFWVNEPKDFEKLYECIRDIAEVLGKETEADTLCEDMENRRQAVLEQVKTAETSPAVFYEIDGSDPAKPWTTGSGTFINELITEAGGYNIASDIEGAWLQIGTEALILRDPEIILLADAEYGTTVESVTTRSAWESLTAVQNGSIYEIDPDIVSRPGPRLVDALETIAELLHPELYQEK